MLSNQITKNFTLEEVVRSDTALRLGIDNSVPPLVERNIQYTAEKMEQIREYLGQPVYPSSWYRCLALNRALKSKDDSDHPKGLAIDFTSPAYGTPLAVCRLLLQYRNNLKWRQLILEHTWVHIGFYPPNIVGTKSEVLTLLSNGTYALGLTDKFGKVI